MTPHNWPEYEIPNPQVSAHAGQFADTVFHLYENKHLVPGCVPSILLEGALALELYLKSLATKTKRHPLEELPTENSAYQLTASPVKRAHLLEELFDAIAPDIREELQNAYAAARIDTPPALREALGQYSNLFVESRYAFERRESASTNITRLVAMLRFLKEQIDAMPLRRR